jgi:hypothetical protein
MTTDKPAEAPTLEAVLVQRETLADWRERILAAPVGYAEASELASEIEAYLESPALTTAAGGAELDALAEKAVESIASRRGENVEEWANHLIASLPENQAAAGGAGEWTWRKNPDGSYTVTAEETRGEGYFVCTDEESARTAVTHLNDLILAQAAAAKRVEELESELASLREQNKALLNSASIGLASQLMEVREFLRLADAVVVALGKDCIGCEREFPISSGVYVNWHPMTQEQADEMHQLYFVENQAVQCRLPTEVSMALAAYRESRKESTDGN